MTRNRRWLLGIGILSFAVLALPAADARDANHPSAPRKGAVKARQGSVPLVLKCWTNREGLRECGNAVPPEYAQDGHTEILSSGVVRERPGAPSAEQLAAAHARAEAERVEREQLSERINRDRVLLSTFTTEEDLHLTRDGKLAVIESRIRLVETRVADLERNQRRLRDHAAQEERSGKGMSKELRAELEGASRQLAEHRQFIVDQRREQEQVRAQFASDLERFRALKSGAVRPGDP